ncbi:hypothetical protein [Butyricicoccus porcorum]|uniref:hypothetical protein n=1 Tax=Butyricicoccus porcorum TaxID=1945634 RepID=UPI002351F90D|nr:hypothetical protein [Butyricicoccus porcorum]
MYDLSAIKPKKVPVMLSDCKQRHLLFDLNALAELEDVYGGHADALKEVQTGSFRAIRATLWAGLLHEDPNLTIKDVGAMIAVDGMSIISDAIVDAFNIAVPTASVADQPPDVCSKDAPQDF